MRVCMCTRVVVCMYVCTSVCLCLVCVKKQGVSLELTGESFMSRIQYFMPRDQYKRCTAIVKDEYVAPTLEACLYSFLHTKPSETCYMAQRVYTPFTNKRTNDRRPKERILLDNKSRHIYIYFK